MLCASLFLLAPQQAISPKHRFSLLSISIHQLAANQFSPRVINLCRTRDRAKLDGDRSAARVQVGNLWVAAAPRYSPDFGSAQKRIAFCSNPVSTVKVGVGQRR